MLGIRKPVFKASARIPQGGLMLLLLLWAAVVVVGCVGLWWVGCALMRACVHVHTRSCLFLGGGVVHGRRPALGSFLRGRQAVLLQQKRCTALNSGQSCLAPSLPPAELAPQE